MRRLLLGIWAAVPLTAQVFTMGTSVDPCVGGSTETAPVTNGTPAIATLRYDPTYVPGATFSCTFPGSNGAGPYLVKLEFIEPSQFAAGLRSFSVMSSETPLLQNVDLFADGATTPAVIIARQFLLVSADGNIRLTFVTVKRSALISRVTLTPFVTQGQASNFAEGEVPAGVIDGTNATFTLAHTPNPPTSLKLYRNGVRQSPGVDFILTGSTITFYAVSPVGGGSAVPQASSTPDTLTADYRY